MSEFKTGAITREELIVNAVPIAFYTAETTDTFQGLWVSPQVEHITGFSPRQFTESPDFWSSRVHPDDRDGVLKDFEN